MQCFNDFVRSNFEQGRRFFIQVGLVLDKFSDVHIKDVHAHSHTHCTYYYDLFNIRHFQIVSSHPILIRISSRELKNVI